MFVPVVEELRDEDAHREMLDVPVRAAALDDAVKVELALPERAEPLTELLRPRDDLAYVLRRGLSHAILRHRGTAERGGITLLGGDEMDERRVHRPHRAGRRERPLL